jgi:hypothetical protein
MSEHVRVWLEAEFRLDARTFDHPSETGAGEWCTPL